MQGFGGEGLRFGVSFRVWDYGVTRFVWFVSGVGLWVWGPW